MKILILNDYANVEGGASNIAIKSALLLSEKHEVIFFAPVGPVDSRLKRSNINVICLNEKDLLRKKLFKSLVYGLWNFYSKNKLE